MKQRIEVRTQAEFDACVKLGNIAVCVGGGFFIARENSSVEAWGNSSVEARENSSVVARENSSVVAFANVFIRLFSAFKIRATAYVTIVKQGPCSEIEGGRQLEPAPEPKTGGEWAEFHGIKPDAPFKVAEIDKRILEMVENDKLRFDMTDWHGGVKCDETNWCKTTHCRAGAAVCLAGKAGFDLEKKYGPEMAGRMIYAVSRPDKPLPDFFASTDSAMADIRASASEAAA